MIPKVKMGGGVPGTPYFPYYSSTKTVSWTEQSDWGLFIILSGKAPYLYLPYTKAVKKAAALEWLQRNPLESTPTKQWAKLAEKLALDLLKKLGEEKMFSRSELILICEALALYDKEGPENSAEASNSLIIKIAGGLKMNPDTF